MTLQMALRPRNLLVAACIAQITSFAAGATIPVSGTPVGASAPIPESFVSYSIELASFPDFAGNLSLPNHFSNNLLNNLGALQGTKPHIRVGGNTQDYALFNASLPFGLNGTINPARSVDYPTTVFIGPSFFESYATWPDTKFSHGFNLGLGANSTAGWETLLATVPLACKALSGGKLLWWEYGNEPDLYSTSAQGPVRPNTWNEVTYIQQWLNGTRTIKALIAENCPDMATNETFGFMAPSFAGTHNTLSPVTTWNDDLNVDGDIKLDSSHNYIGGATQPGVTLQGTLMNHTSTVTSISLQLALRDSVAKFGVPFILGETNSLFNEGAPGLSNAFGAALWGVDFNLWCASQGIQRVHMHQGTNFRYASWQPIETNITTIGTKPPYYGNIAVAAFMGDLVSNSLQIANLPLPSAMEAAYAAYVDGALARIAVINLREYNYTVNGTSTVLNPVPRPSQTYSFSLPISTGSVKIQRLLANGSDAISGITWDGTSYNWELNNGKPVKLGNVTTGETARVTGGLVNIVVPDSSAVIVNV